MSHLPATTSTGNALAVQASDNHSIFVTLTVADQMFGVPVALVQDVLSAQRITRVPLAPPEVLGSLNLRGRIVTAIDIRTRLGLPARKAELSPMSVVVDHQGELYSLIVDGVGEVMSLSTADYEKNPITLDPHWQEVSNGIYRLKHCLLSVLDIARLLRLNNNDDE